MGVFEGASRAGSGRAQIEWPTGLALAGCYASWALALWFAPDLGWFYAIPGAVTVAFHSSLQHEVLHGHPTRKAWINEALVFPPVGLFIPYRRFRDLHLKHHNDERLTDPYDDPESFYLTPGDWSARCAVMCMLLRFNATFAGRMLIGPALAMWAFWRTEAGLMLRGDRAIIGAWVRHMLGLVPVLLAVNAAGVDLWFYALAAAYPGMSLIMVRSFIEHRAAHDARERTAIIEGGLFWRLLFLNNNYHAVHHAWPALAWYRVPEAWRATRREVLERNGGYLLPGYGAIAWRWLFRAREPVVHPLARHDGDGA